MIGVEGRPDAKNSSCEVPLFFDHDDVAFLGGVLGGDGMGGGGELSAFGVIFGGRVLTFLDKFKNFTDNEVAFVFLCHLFFNNFVSKYYGQVHQLIKFDPNSPAAD